MNERIENRRFARLEFYIRWVVFLWFFTVANAYGAEEWEQAVLEVNESSIVFISVKATRPNGLVDVFTGTGLIVHPDGYVLTCSHVVPKEEATYRVVEATGSVGSRYEFPSTMEVIRRDDQLDLALLKLPRRAFRWRSVELSGQGKNGSKIVVFGFPLTENLLGVPGSITSTDGKGGRWLTNASINRGMSGGPVFDRNGAIVAIAAAGYEEAQGLNLIIPISFAKNLLDTVNSPLLSARAPSQHGEDSDFIKKREMALRLGYDSAFALAHARMGRVITQEKARLSEYLHQLSMDNIVFPDNPLGEQKDALPASTFAQEVAGTLEARDFRLQRAFLVGWLGVIAINTPSMKPPEFDLRKFAKESGFPDSSGKSDVEYLEGLVKQTAPEVSGGPETLLAQSPPDPKPCRHPAHGVEKWNSQNEWTADSGWRGGGSSPGEYCGTQLLSRQRKYPDRKVELIDSGEEHKSEYTPFKHDYYKYSCSFRESWDPVYKLVVSENCPQ